MEDAGPDQHPEEPFEAERRVAEQRDLDRRQRAPGNRRPCHAQVAWRLGQQRRRGDEPQIGGGDRSCRQEHRLVEHRHRRIGGPTGADAFWNDHEGDSLFAANHGQRFGALRRLRHHLQIRCRINVARDRAGERAAVLIDDDDGQVAQRAAPHHGRHRRQHHQRKQREQEKVERGTEDSRGFLPKGCRERAHCGQSNRTLIPGRSPVARCVGSSFTAKA